MRIASFNVENLFQRARALNQETWDLGRPILDQHAEINRILQNKTYTDANKKRLVELIKSLGLAKSDTAKFVILRQNHGRLLSRGKTGKITITADGRDDWIGWVELRNEPVNDVAIFNTARVIKEVEADIQAVVEVENRVTLKEFNDEIVRQVGGTPFEHVMLIDGNDQRGIDVGLMTRDGFPIGLMRSHVDDKQPNGSLIFSRDCPEYCITTPSGKRLWVLVNHFKSKGFGVTSASNAKRRAQATAVKEIYKRLKSDGEKHVVVLGDFNDTPASAPLKPLIDDTDLKDVSEHSEFNDGGYPGTFGGATKNNKIDYILVSPDLFSKVKDGGIFRKGAWPGVRPKKWDTFPELKKPIQAASDHQAIWADIDI